MELVYFLVGAFICFCFYKSGHDRINYLENEIKKLNDQIRLEGNTLIPLKIYFVKNRAKVLLGVCKGKKNYDKRETIKERDIKRDIEKKLKERY